MKESISKSPSGRVQRTKVGTRNRLTVLGKDPDKVYRIVNDDGYRIEQFKAAGYEVVQAKDVQVGDRRVDGATPEGSAASIPVGLGKTGVVMAIRKDWYDEDRAEELRAIKELEDTTIKEALNGNYGSIKIERS